MGISATPSYESLTNIDTFLQQHIETTLRWKTLDTTRFTLLDDQKRAYVVQSMAILDSFEWIGDKVSSVQTNEFPRTFTNYIDFYYGYYDSQYITTMDLSQYQYPFNISYLETATGIVFPDLKRAQKLILVELLSYETRDYREIGRGRASNVTLPGGLSVTLGDFKHNPMFSKEAMNLMKYYSAEVVNGAGSNRIGRI